MDILHTSCIHSPIVGHLGCFHALAIVNSAAVNIGASTNSGCPFMAEILHTLPLLSLLFEGFQDLSPCIPLPLVCSACPALAAAVPSLSCLLRLSPPLPSLEAAFAKQVPVFHVLPSHACSHLCVYLLPHSICICIHFLSRL